MNINDLNDDNNEIPESAPVEISDLQDEDDEIIDEDDKTIDEEELQYLCLPLLPDYWLLMGLPVS